MEKTTDGEISFLFRNLDMILRNSTQGEFAYIWKSNWVTINFYEDYKNANFFFLSYVFAAVAVLRS